MALKEVKIIRPQRTGEQTENVRVGAYCRVETRDLVSAKFVFSTGEILSRLYSSKREDAFSRYICRRRHHRYRNAENGTSSSVC